MTTPTKPRRVTPATTASTKKAPKSDHFELPEAKLDLEFFLRRDGKSYTSDQLVQEIFGDAGFAMTDQEKVYAILKAIEELELTMPFEFECPKCGTPNPIAVEICQVMEASGTPRKTFTVEFDGLIFQFDRPEHVQDTSDLQGLAGIGMYMMQWLVGHNQGPDFEFVHLKIGTFVKLAKAFGDFMFRVNFHVENHCASCQAPISEDFGVSLDDITTLINEM